MSVSLTDFEIAGKKMIKVVYCMRRKQGLSHEEFLSHWADVHVPIVMANLDVLAPCLGYVRTLPQAHPFSARVERAGVMQPPYDGIAELTWASEEDMRLAFESRRSPGRAAAARQGRNAVRRRGGFMPLGVAARYATSDA